MSGRSIPHIGEQRERDEEGETMMMLPHAASAAACWLCSYFCRRVGESERSQKFDAPWIIDQTLSLSLSLSLFIRTWPHPYVPPNPLQLKKLTLLQRFLFQISDRSRRYGGVSTYTVISRMADNSGRFQPKSSNQECISVGWAGVWEGSGR